MRHMRAAALNAACEVGRGSRAEVYVYVQRRRAQGAEVQRAPRTMEGDSL
jgi:hypothetical protein